MLPDKLFKIHEPRNVFPFFENCENRLSYVLRNTHTATPKQALRYVAGRLLRRDYRNSPEYLSRIVVDSFRGMRLSFRGAFLTRDGKLLATFPTFASVKYPEGIDISVNDLLEKHNVPKQDGQFLLIADRGIKLDTDYTTGTITATYISPHGFTCYRNGIFARPVNHFHHHRPVGFRSIAPHMCVTDSAEASAYFFNFSSDLNFSDAANPKTFLYRNDQECLEADFGTIPPFGAAERSITEIFGDEAKSFLQPTHGFGTLIAEQTGITLGSIHLIRNQETRSMSIEHTRPTHMYVL